VDDSDFTQFVEEVLHDLEDDSDEDRYSRFSYNAIVAFLKNPALWKNRVIETIGSVGIKGLGVESSNSPSRM
jgi:hypothetical protein